jgi:outer membrane lipoprotein-sorting protein
MKKLFILLLLTAVLIFNLEAQTLEEVLNSHYKTIGQKKFSKVNSMKATGKSIFQGMETNFATLQIRPDKFRLEVDIQGALMIQAFDGEKAWFVAPWTGTTDPIELSGDQFDALKRQADFDGMLYNFEEKGYITELAGKEDMEGTEVFRINQTDKDQNTYSHFIDVENFVLLKTSMKMKVGESEVESETLFSNYREQDGMLVAFSIESRTNGQTMSQINIENLEFDASIDPSVFTMPPKQEKPAQE